MNGLMVSQKVNKVRENKPGMGSSFGRLNSTTDIEAQSNMKTDVYAQQYDLLCSVKCRHLNTSMLDMNSKEPKVDDQKKKHTAISAWLEFRERVKRAYRTAGDQKSDSSISDELGSEAKKLADCLWRDDWQQLLIKLQVLLRELATEAREKLRRAAVVQGLDKPEGYVRSLLTGYDAFRVAGEALAPCLPAQIDKLLTKRFTPADFRLLNARMFESCVYSDPMVQDSVPAAIGRAAGADRQLVRSYLALDEQMTDVASRWLDVKKLILQLGKGRAQLLDDWQTCKEMRELAADARWRVRPRPPSVCLLPDFDVQLLSLADELSADRSCACSTEDLLPDTPPLSPDQPDLLSVTDTAPLLSSVHSSLSNSISNTQIPDKLSSVKQTGSKNQGSAAHVNKENADTSGSKTSKEIETKNSKTDKTDNVCTHSLPRTIACDHKQKSIIYKKKLASEEKCTHEKAQCDKKKASVCQCECPHGDSSEAGARQSTKYNKLRERLRTRLKEKQRGGQQRETTAPAENADDRDIAQLLNFIEGNQVNTDPVRAQKNAARKLRRQERKLEAERQRQEEERLKQEQERLQQEQQRLQLKQENAAKANFSKSNKNNKGLTQTIEEATKKVGPMVTIKRVMQGSNKEPTVTITLKGSTPDKDKLLFTLINGQSENSRSETNAQAEAPPVVQPQLSKKQRKKLKKEKAQAAVQTQLTQLLPKKEVKDSVVSKTKCSVNNNKSSANSDSDIKENSVKVSLNAKTDSVLNLQMLRLPPGITITKVEGPAADRKLHLNTKTNSTQTTQNSNSAPPADNRSGIIVVDTVKLKQELPPNAEKNSTQRNKKNKKKKNKKTENTENVQNEKKITEEKSTSSNNKSGTMFTLKNPMFYQVQEGNNDLEKQTATNQQASIIKGANGMVTIRSPRLGSCTGGGGIPFMSLQAVASDLKPGHILGELKPVVQPPVTAVATPAIASDKPFDAQQILSGLPGIEITKIHKGATRTRTDRAAFQPADVSIIPTSMAANGDVYKLFYDNADWSLESVFAPKDLKEDEILDADELELEAFKRFCQQSVPPERKEKVAYLNVKDIILKKKASGNIC